MIDQKTTYVLVCICTHVRSKHHIIQESQNTTSHGDSHPKQQQSVKENTDRTRAKYVFRTSTYLL